MIAPSVLQSLRHLAIYLFNITDELSGVVGVAVAPAALVVLVVIDIVVLDVVVGEVVVVVVVGVVYNIVANTLYIINKMFNTIIIILACSKIYLFHKVYALD